MIWRGLGNTLGEGLGQASQNFVETQNTLQQQDEQRQQREQDNAFRQAQLTEQQRQFDQNFKFQRDNTVFSYLNDRRGQVAKLLSEGGFTPGTLEHGRVTEGLKATDKLLGKVVRGEELAPDELEQYDSLLEGLGGLTAVGAGTIGQDLANDRSLTLQGKSSQNQITAANAAVAAGTALDVIEQAGLKTDAMRLGNEGQEQQNRTLTTQANIAERTEDAQVQQQQNQAGLSAVQLRVATETADSSVKNINATNDLSTARAEIYKGMVGLEGAAQQAEYLGQISAQGGIGAALVQQMVDKDELPAAVGQAVKDRAARVDTRDKAQTDILEDQAAITDTDRQYAEAVLQPRIAVFKSDASLKQKLNTAREGLIPLETAGQRAAYLNGIAQTGAAGAAVIDGLAASNTITPAEAAGARKTAENVSLRDNAETTTAKEGAKQAQYQTQLTSFEVQKVQQTLVSTIGRINAENDLGRKTAIAAQGLVGLQAGAQRAEYLAAIAATGDTGATIINGLVQSGAITPSQGQAALAAARDGQTLLTNGVTQSNNQTTLSTMDVLKVRETIRGEIAAINASNSLTVATAQAEKAILPFKEAQQKQEALNAIASSGFMGLETLRGLHASGKISTAQFNRATQAARQAQRIQNNTVGMSDLEYLTASQQASAALNQQNGNDVTDKKSMLTALTEMRKINSQNLRTAQSNFRMVASRYLPNAKILADRWDPKAYITAVGNANLTPEQRAELDAAAEAMQVYQGEANDLSTAFAQVSSSGKLDPALAERLGFWTSPDPAPPAASGGSGTGGASGGASGGDYGYTTYNGVSYVTNFPGGGIQSIPRNFTPEARAAIEATALRLGVDPNGLAAVISFETAGTFSPSQRNMAGSTGTGLIQFMASTARDMGTTTDALARMSFTEQMKWVERYLRERGIGPGSSMADIYEAVTGSGYRRGTDAYDQNKVWDSNNNGIIEANEQTNNPKFAAHVRPYFGKRVQPDKAAAPAPRGYQAPPLAGRPVQGQAAVILTNTAKSLNNVPPAQRGQRVRAMLPQVAKQLSSALGVTVTPAQVEQYLNANGAKFL